VFSLHRGRLPGQPAGDDLASRHAVGADAGSGQVAADAPIRHTDPDAGGRADDLGRHEVLTSPQGGADLAPIVGPTTRTMLGGVRTAGHSELLRDAPPFMGGHVQLAGRGVGQVVIEVGAANPGVTVSPDPAPQLPSLRVPPVSDPLGRMCANAAAAKGRS
jgi:hypothetical protein